MPERIHSSPGYLTAVEFGVQWLRGRCQPIVFTENRPKTV
jgi:hypothetical protein